MKLQQKHLKMLTKDFWNYLNKSFKKDKRIQGL